jgi:hypothetical protein
MKWLNVKIVNFINQLMNQREIVLATKFQQLSIQTSAQQTVSSQEIKVIINADKSRLQEKHEGILSAKF